MKVTYLRLPAAIVLAAACALSMPATAQNDGKRALATKLAQIQLKADSAALAEQLTATAVQPVLVWRQRSWLLRLVWPVQSEWLRRKRQS